MDYNLAPYLVLHFSQAINDELEGLKGLPNQLGKKKTKNLDALMSLIWWCLLYSNGKNDIIVRYLKKNSSKHIFEYWRFPEEQPIRMSPTFKIRKYLAFYTTVILF